ncbi:MAG: peroxiredoxin [Pseudomonadota bacterium]
MAISVGDTLPEASFLRIGSAGPESVSVSELVKGKKVVIFGLPGAYTGTCTTAHVPSFMRTIGAFKEKGVDDVICVAVNDPFVMDQWGKDTGAADAGIVMLGDAASDFTLAIGMDFDAPPVGFKSRSKRYSMLVEDGVVTVLNAESNPGECEISAGETLLEQV